MRLSDNLIDKWKGKVADIGETGHMSQQQQGEMPHLQCRTQGA